MYSLIFACSGQFGPVFWLALCAEFASANLCVSA